MSVVDVTDSALSYDELALSGGDTIELAGDTADTFLFAFSGDATVRFDVDSDEERSEQLKPGHAVFVPAGSTARLEAGPDGFGAARAHAGADCDVHAPLGSLERVASVETAASAGATGKRTFQILFGAENGSCRATFFVGYIPPGKAPWHFHQYDEIVWICEGTGRFHTAEGTTELGERDAVRMRPRQIHIMENPSDTEELVVLGLFTPAGSPAAAFLAADPRS